MFILYILDSAKPARITPFILQRYSEAHVAFNPTFALATFFTGITPFMLQRYSNKCFKANVFWEEHKRYRKL
jgi:hypothetical protein